MKLSTKYGTYAVLHPHNGLVYEVEVTPNEWDGRRHRLYEVSPPDGYYFLLGHSEVRGSVFGYTVGETRGIVLQTEIVTAAEAAVIDVGFA